MAAKKSPPAELTWRDDPLYAFGGPFIMFMTGLALVSFFKQKEGTVFQTNPEFWIYPLQTVVCAIGLAIWWKHYRFKPLDGKSIGIGVAAGLLILAIWISPQWLFGAKPRLDGFNPTLVQHDASLYYGSIVMRMIRLAIVVPFVEEIFWRGLLMRYLIKEDFTSVPFGQYALHAFGIVAVAFMLVHSTADWPAALVTGVIFNAVAVYTRSLGACVIAHAVVNLLLGVYILQTKQWGFW